jgi:hypothetical protein
MAQNKYSLTFNTSNFKPQSQEFQGKTINIRAFEKIVYVSNPVDTTKHILIVVTLMAILPRLPPYFSLIK